MSEFSLPIAKAVLSSSSSSSTTTTSSSSSLYDVVYCRDSIENGKGLFVSYDVKPGRIVVEEEPIIGWTERKYSLLTCSHCYRYNDNDVINDTSSSNFEICESCQRVCWCSSQCKLASRNFHSTNICNLLAEGLMNCNADEDLVLQLCCGLISLKENNEKEKIDKFMNQNGDSVDLNDIELLGCQKICQLLNGNGYPDITLEWIKTVFKKDKACGFAVMLPPTKRGDMISNSIDTEDDEEDEEGMIRGYGVYPTLGLTNHSCIPNCIRWDNADVGGDILPNDRRKMSYRALIPLPRGSELYQSYVPLPWDYEERQSYLKEMFGFVCKCKRCEVEKYEYDIEMENAAEKRK